MAIHDQRKLPGYEFNFTLPLHYGQRRQEQISIIESEALSHSDMVWPACHPECLIENRSNSVRGLPRILLSDEIQNWKMWSNAKRTKASNKNIVSETYYPSLVYIPLKIWRYLFLGICQFKLLFLLFVGRNVCGETLSAETPRLHCRAIITAPLQLIINW